jgi:Zn-dependent peptidase ImmA (M78 family)
MASTAEKVRVPFNREVLKWARERVKLSPESAAKGAGVTVDHIYSWEKEGGGSPTVKQGRKLASVYDVPFMELLSKDQPKIKDLELVPDFRMHSGAEAPTELHELLMIQGEAEETRLNALDLYDMLGLEPPVLSDGFFSAVDKDTEAAAATARGMLKLPIGEQLSRKGNDKAKFINAFRNYLGRAGIITMKNSGLAAFGARGMCLFASPLPVIIFSKEAPTAQAFTLAHELGHVALRESGISGPIGSAPNKTKAKQIEDWCNGFAGAFLMPRDEVARVLPAPAPQSLQKLMKKYCLDTSGLSNPLEFMPEDIHPTPWAKIAGLVTGGTFAVTVEIYDELKLLPGPIGECIKANDAALQMEVGEENWD